MRANEIVNKTAKIRKVTAVAAVMSIHCRKKCKLKSTNSRNQKPSHHKAKSTKFLEENSRELKSLSQKMRKGRTSKK
jgi:hypothetical protein